MTGSWGLTPLDRHRVDSGESIALLFLFSAQVGAEYLIVIGALPVESFAAGSSSFRSIS